MKHSLPLLEDSLERGTSIQRKRTGVHYTPEKLAAFVAARVAECDLGARPRILDPAVGNGELLAALLSQKRLTGAAATGFDIDERAVDFTRRRLGSGFTDATISVRVQDFLTLALEHREGGLLATTEKYDAVIANPPYVRTQVMGASRSQELSKKFALSGRVDLCFAFVEGIAEVLRPGGVAGIIVSNRFMTTKAGAVIRERILERFDVLHVWDLGDSKLFEAAVLPAVLLLRKKVDSGRVVSRFSSIYTTPKTAVQTAGDEIEALEKAGEVSVSGTTFLVQHGELNHGPGKAGIWRIATAAGDQWLKQVEAKTFCTFGDIGKIRVGVKTTADKVFIKERWPSDERPELLRRLVTHKVARRYRAMPADREILYTHEMRGGRKRVVDLVEHPLSGRYLEGHRAALERRRYVIEAGRQWFEIWVPQHPDLWSAPKLVFPDISEKPVFWMSLEEEVINGDCYWLAASAEKTDLLWLALAVANSPFIEVFYDHAFNNKLYAGRRRFMTQYVEKFPIPDPTTAIAREIVASARRVHELASGAEAEALSKRLESLVEVAFGLAKEIPGQRNL